MILTVAAYKPSPKHLMLRAQSPILKCNRGSLASTNGLLFRPWLALTKITLHKSAAKEAVARDYLGKIIQLPIKLSEVSTDAVSSYIQDLFPQAQPSADSQNTGGPTIGRGGPQQRQGSQNADTNDIREPSVKQETTESLGTRSGSSKRPVTHLEPESSDGRKAPLVESEEEIEAFKILSNLFNISNSAPITALAQCLSLTKSHVLANKIPNR